MSSFYRTLTCHKEQCLASTEHFLVIQNNVWLPQDTYLSYRTMSGFYRTLTCHTEQCLASTEHQATCHTEQCLASTEHLLVIQNNVWLLQNTYLSYRTMSGFYRTLTCHTEQYLGSTEYLPGESLYPPLHSRMHSTFETRPSISTTMQAS